MLMILSAFFACTTPGDITIPESPLSAEVAEHDVALSMLAARVAALESRALTDDALVDGLGQRMTALEARSDAAYAEAENLRSGLGAVMQRIGGPNGYAVETALSYTEASITIEAGHYYRVTLLPDAPMGSTYAREYQMVGLSSAELRAEWGISDFVTLDGVVCTTSGSYWRFPVPTTCVETSPGTWVLTFTPPKGEAVAVSSERLF